MNRRRTTRFNLGDFEVRPLHGQIVGPNGQDHIQPKVMELLLELAERPGEIVTRRELLEAVWGDADTADDALNRCISELRHHLDDHREHPRYIQTVPKRGYRLITDVIREDDASDSTETGTSKQNVGIWEDLRRRRVFRVVLAYAVVAWLLLQVADVTFNALKLPDWAITFVTVVFVLGFPVAAVMGWALQVTAEGVVLDDAGKSARKTRLLRMGGVSLIAVLGVVVWALVFEPFSETGAGPGETEPAEMLPVPPQFAASIAVLPFLNLSEDPANDYIGHGIADELIHRLASIRDLKVAARTSSFVFQEASADIPAIARELQVQTILEGSVRREEDKIRILAQLVDSTGFHLWSASFDRQIDELLDVQSEIALVVAGKISVSLSPENREMLAAMPTESGDAYNSYLQAREYLRRPRSDQVLSSAKELFDRATEIDPRFAQAYAGLCDTHLAWYVLSKSTDHFADAEAACFRSRTLSDTQASTYFALGQLYRISGQYEKARDELMRGLEIQPGAAQGYEQLGRTYHAQNKLRAAEQLLRTAIELQPADWNMYKSLGNFLYRNGRYADAVNAYQNVIVRSPDNAPGYNNLAAAYYMLDDFENAAAAWTKSLEIEPSRSAFLNTGAMHYFTGDFELAEQALTEALRLAEDDFRAWGRLGATYRHMPGRESDAHDAFMRARELAENDLRVNPDDAYAMRYSALFHVRTGERQEARRLIRMALEREPVHPDTDLIAALVYLALDEQERALDHLERGIANGLSTKLVRAEPDFAALRPVERFERMTEREKEAQEQE